MTSQRADHNFKLTHYQTVAAGAGVTVAKPSEIEIARLTALREKLTAQYNRIAAVSDNQRVATEAISSIDREISELDGEIQRAWQAWTEGSCDEGAKRRLVDRRRILAARRVTAIADLESAHVAFKAIEPQLGTLNNRMAEINDKIIDLKVQDLVAEAGKIREGAGPIVDQLCEVTTRLMSLRQTLFNCAVKASDQRQAAGAQVLHIAASQVATLGLPTSKGVDPVRLATFDAEWRLVLGL